MTEKEFPMNRISKTVLFLAVAFLYSGSLFCKQATNTVKKDQPSAARSRRRLISSCRTQGELPACAAQVDCIRKDKPSRARTDTRLVLPIDTQMAYPLRGGF